MAITEVTIKATKDSYICSVGVKDGRKLKMWGYKPRISPNRVGKVERANILVIPPLDEEDG